jgi:hypothetical protein
VTAYDGLTGLRIWSLAGVVAEGTDSAQGRFDLTQGTSLLEVDPLTGHIVGRAAGSAVAGSAGMFAVRDGVALGLDQGGDGEAWGYDVSAQRVVWTAAHLPWPHYFVDASGIGGSAEPDGATVVVAACGKLAPKSATPPAASASGSAAPGRPAPGTPAPGTAASGSAGTPSASGPASATPGPVNPSARICQDPELVAIYR